MTTTTSTNSAAGAAANTAASTKKKSSTGTETPGEIQERFMSLLVAQLKNQDPMQPMDNAAVTSQMAQLNTVTGINTLNDTMKAMATSVSSGQTLQATNLLGRTVLLDGKDLALSGGKAGAAVELGQNADTVSVEIKNAAGTTVRTLNLGAVEKGIHEFDWNGKDDSGAMLADGKYTFEVNATAAGEKAQIKGLSITSVVGLNNDSATPQLLTAAGTKVSVSDIKQIF